MSLNMNTEFYTTFIDPDTGDTMKLTLIPGFIDYPTGAMPTKQLPTNFIVNKCEVDSRFKDFIPIGKQLANVMSLDIDISGLFDRGTNTWTDLTALIVSGQSAGLSNDGTIGYIQDESIPLPNVWRLDNVTTSTVKFLGTQKPTPGHTWTNERKATPLKIIGLEALIYESISNSILADNIEPYMASVYSPYPALVRSKIYQHEYEYLGNHFEYVWGGKFMSERGGKGSKLDLQARFITVPENVDYILDYLTSTIIKQYLRDTTATTGHTNTYLVAHSLYKQDRTIENERGALLAESDIYCLPQVHDGIPSFFGWGICGGILDDDSGLYKDQAVGWASSPNVWDMMSSLCEQGYCKLLVDYNTSDTLSVKFEQLFDTAVKAILTGEAKGAKLDQDYNYSENFSVTRVGTYENEINEIVKSKTRTDDGDSFDITAMFEAVSHVPLFQWASNLLVVQSQNIPNIRGLYAKEDLTDGSKNMKSIHDYFKITLGDSQNAENSPTIVYSVPLPPITVPDPDKPGDQLQDWINDYTNFLYFRSYQSMNTYNIAAAKLFENNIHGLLTMTVKNSVLTNQDLGKNYTIDTDLIVEGLDTAFDQKVVLTGAVTDYVNGKTKCSFYVRGENAL